jgi:hypothetical protein
MFTQSNVARQHNPLSRDVVEDRFWNWMPLTDCRMLVYSELRSVPIVGGFVDVAPSGLHGTQESSRGSRGVAYAVAARAREKSLRDILMLKI